MANKLILLDVDGVLLEWEQAFDSWMSSQGYEKTSQDTYDVGSHYDLSVEARQLLIQIFNESASMRYLEPIDGAVEYVKRLHQDGNTIHLITSQSLLPMANRARQDNLKELFGDIFEKIVFLDTGSSKDEALSRYPKGSYWVEDKPENAVAGVKAGMIAMLYTQPHNKSFKHKDVTRCDTWKEVYQFISAK